LSYVLYKYTLNEYNIPILHKILIFNKNEKSTKIALKEHKKNRKKTNKYHPFKVNIYNYPTRKEQAKLSTIVLELLAFSFLFLRFFVSLLENTRKV